jgi:hypothetical protein
MNGKESITYANCLDMTIYLFFFTQNLLAPRMHHTECGKVKWMLTTVGWKDQLNIKNAPAWLHDRMPGSEKSTNIT